MKSLTSHINEALVAGRAWSGRLRNIDNLLSWMYDEGILTKTDMNKKDSLFHKYYRYYNDGDMPRGVSKYGTKADMELELEQQVTDFMKKILSKYAGKYDRQQFKLSSFISELLYAKNNLDEDSLSVNSVKYFVERAGFSELKGSDFYDIILKLESANDDFRKKLKEHYEAEQKTREDLPSGWDSPVGKITGVMFSEMQKMNCLPKNASNDFAVIKNLANQASLKIDKMIEAAKEANKLVFEA